MTGQNGEQIVLQPPAPLPLPKAAASPAPVITSPAPVITSTALSPIMMPTTPVPVNTKSNPVPHTPVPTTTMETQIVLQPPAPLPLFKAVASPALPVITSPALLSPSMVSATVKTKSNPVPPVPTTTGSCEDDDSDSDFDILHLQEKIQEIQKRIATKKEQKKKKPTVVSQSWLGKLGINMMMATTMTNANPPRATHTTQTLNVGANLS